MKDFSKYYKPEKDIEMNPVDYFNMYETWAKPFEGFEVEYNEEKNEFTFKNNVVGKIEEGYFLCTEKFLLEKGFMKQMFVEGKKYTKFMIFTLLRHNKNFTSAILSIQLKNQIEELPYIRVGTVYYKIVNKPNKYDIIESELKVWKKDEIKQDFNAHIINHIPKFDDFIVRPDNLTYQRNINGFYNLYSPFPHTPFEGNVTPEMIPFSLQILKHIFQEQFETGLKYMKILYEMPYERTYVLCLVSKEGSTGKTTFLKWLAYIFGGNFANVDIDTLEGIFNGSYKDKNIIAVDEAVSDKGRVVEKIKAMITQDTITSNEKYVNHYKLENFIKLVLCSNKETEFLKIEDTEQRFWVRKVPRVPLKYKQLDIVKKLIEEIPMFLKYLLQLPKIIVETRFVLPYEEVENDSLKAVKFESKNWLYKELMELITGYFENSLYEEFYATPKDIKDKFFQHNNQVQISYIRKVLNNDFKKQTVPQCRFYPFNDKSKTSINGTPFLFKLEEFKVSRDINSMVESEENSPF